MERLSWIHFGMFLLGLFLLLGSVFAGLVATEYAIAHETTTEDAMEVSGEINRYGVTDYDDLSTEEQQIVDGAVAGETYRFETDDDIAARWDSARVVRQGDHYHYIPRQRVIDWGSPAGIASIVLALAGLALIGEPIRRHHFPHYRPFASSDSSPKWE